MKGISNYVQLVSMKNKLRAANLRLKSVELIIEKEMKKLDVLYEMKKDIEELHAAKIKYWEDLINEIQKQGVGCR
jgi:hypothetical protein